MARQTLVALAAGSVLPPVKVPARGISASYGLELGSGPEPDWATPAEDLIRGRSESSPS